jgi:GNAT superfamily N-acetyltransferase
MFKVQKANMAEHHSIIVDFQLKMAQETENLTLDKDIVFRGVEEVFKDKSKGQYFVALDDQDKCIASLLTVNEWSDWRCKNVIWIHSVYVIESMRSKKVFKEMYLYLKEMVTKSDELGGLRLYVDKTNKKAQSVYQKIGMSNEHYELYEWLK